MTDAELMGLCFASTSGGAAELYVSLVTGRHQAAHEPLNEAMLGIIPLSLLLLDVKHHVCDLFHASQCWTCRRKLEEIDRRFPAPPR